MFVVLVVECCFVVVWLCIFLVRVLLILVCSSFILYVGWLGWVCLEYGVWCFGSLVVLWCVG